MNEFALKNAKVVTPKEIFEAGIYVKAGKIAQILRKGDILRAELKNGILKNRCKIIDLKGKYLLPGLIDVHAHFRTPGMTKKEDWISGSRAALTGGVTTVLDMPNTIPPTIDLISLKAKRAIVRRKSFVNYGFYVGATSKNLKKIKKIKNIAGVKIYMSPSTGNLLMSDKKTLEHFMLAVKHLLAVHLSGDVKTVLHLAKKYQVRVHICHVSGEKELKLIKKFKGASMSAEITPHHLFLTEEDYKKQGNLLKINPPLQGFADQVALWDAIKSGLIDMVATDHAPHLLEEKRLSYERAPAGVPGIQTMLPLLLNAVNEGKLTLQRVVRLTSYNPARLFNISGKGEIKAGADADLTVVDMDLSAKVDEKYLWSKCGWSPFTGRKLKGWPVMTFVAGNLMYEWREKFGTHLGHEVEFER